MRSIFIVINIWLTSVSAIAQQLSIDECYRLARENYPQVQQRALIQKSKDYSVATIAKGYLPQISINGQATYQSDVTQVPIKLPGADMPVISKDQYKIYGEVTKTLYDGGALRIQRNRAESTAEIEDYRLEVELYKLKERVNQLFFGILMIDEQLLQVQILKKDIELGIARSSAAIEQGAALKSSLDVLYVELLKITQRIVELNSSRDAFVDMLSLFVNKELNDNTVFIKPVYLAETTDIKRPELSVFASQRKLVDVQKQSIRAKNMPRVGLFFQGGYGRPALNMLNNSFDLYYIGGIRFSWSLSGLYTRSRDYALLDINRNALYIQQQTFLFNTSLTLRQQNSEIIKLEALLKSDNEIIALRTKIKDTALIQLNNGVLGTSDYLRELNAEDQAKQTYLLHRIQLLMTRYNQLSISGNL